MRVIYKVHLWVGLVAGIIILVQTCSGIAIAFRPELQRLNYPEGMPRDRSFDGLVDRAIRAVPGERIERLKVAKDGSRIVRMHVRTNAGASELVVIDSDSGRILDRGPLWQFPTELALQLHGSMLLGRAGELVTALAGLALTLLCVTGILLWWPGYGRLWHKLRIRRFRNRVTLLFDLHKLAGVLAAPLYLLIGLTGVGVTAISFLPVSPPLPVSLGLTMTSGIDAAVAAAQHSIPGALPTDVFFDDTSSGFRPVLIIFRGGVRSNHRAWHELQLEDQGAIVSHEHMSQATRFQTWLLLIHSGEIGGLPGRLAGLAGGLTLALLTMTGIWLWFDRERMRMRNRRRKRSASDTQ